MTGARAALALSVTLVFGNLVERRRELAILHVVGWKQRQVRREIAVEMALQGLFGGILALALVAVGSDLFSQITIALPANLPGENPCACRQQISGRCVQHRASGFADGLGLAAGSVPGRFRPRGLRLVDGGRPQGAKSVVGHQGSVILLPRNLQEALPKSAMPVQPTQVLIG